MARGKSPEEGGWPSQWKGTPEERRKFRGEMPDVRTYIDGVNKPNLEKDSNPGNADNSRVLRDHHSCKGKGCPGCTNGKYWYKISTNGSGVLPQQNDSVRPPLDLDQAVRNGLGTLVTLPNGMRGVQIRDTTYLPGGLFVRRDENGKLLLYRTQTPNGASNRSFPVRDLPTARPQRRPKKAS